jgi:hypothetical protein
VTIPALAVQDAWKVAGGGSSRLRGRYPRCNSLSPPAGPGSIYQSLHNLPLQRRKNTLRSLTHYLPSHVQLGLRDCHHSLSHPGEGEKDRGVSSYAPHFGPVFFSPGTIPPRLRHYHKRHPHTQESGKCLAGSSVHLLPSRVSNVTSAVALLGNQ